MPKKIGTAKKKTHKKWWKYIKWAPFGVENNDTKMG